MATDRKVSTVPGYSVHVATTAPPEATSDLTVPGRLEQVLDEFADLLQDHHGVPAAGPTQWSATVTIDVDGQDAVAAASRGKDLVITLAGKAGLPDWPVVRLEVVREDELDAQLQRPAMPELVGPAEAAELLGVSRQRIHQLNDRHRRHLGFPHPLIQVRMGPLWAAAAIRAFDRNWDRRPGRRRQHTPATDPATAGPERAEA